MEKEAEAVQQGSSNIVRILKGSVFAVISTLILLFIYAILLTFTNIPENTIAACTVVISCISILIGSSISAMKIKKAGILNGGLVGLIYIAVVYIFSSVLQTGFMLTLSSVIIMVCGILAGMVGRHYWGEYKVNE